MESDRPGLRRSEGKGVSLSCNAKTFLFSLTTCALLCVPKVGFSQSSLQWRTLVNAPIAYGRMDDVFFVSPNRGWIIVNPAFYQNRLYGNSIWRTTDGGASWEYQITLEPYLRSIGFVDSLVGWVGILDSPDSILFQTTDGGTSWSLVTNIPEPKPQGICGISVVNDSVVYASGRFYGPARVIKTTDRGVTWTSFDLSAYAGALVDCFFFTPDSGFVVGGSSDVYDTGYTRILFTSDGGSTWAIRHAGNRSHELCWKIHFLNRNIVYVSIERFAYGPTYYLKTTDGGLTWNDQLFKDDLFDVQGIGFVSEEMGWLGGWGGYTYETVDGGASWHPTSRGGYYVNRFRFLDRWLGYAVGQTVYKYSFFSCTAISGDANGSGGRPNLVDIVYLINFIFRVAPEPSPACKGDPDGDGSISFLDIIYLVNFVFKGGPVPVKVETCCM